MSPSKASDLRSFISPSPLPIRSHQGLKITARSEGHYNCAVPSRQEVAHQNYVRRTKQLAEEGYQAPNYKPYQLLGEPLILEDRQLILYALGQLDEKEVDELRNKKKEEAAQKTRPEETQKDAASDAPPPKKFVIRRSTKSQKSLGKEVVYGRKMVNLAKLGHGFFTLIKEEEEARKTEELKEQQELEEQKKREWQPALIDSSDEEEVDPDLGRDEALSPYMNHGEKGSSESFRLNPSEMSGKESTLQVPSQNSLHSLPSPSPLAAGTTPARKRRKKKKCQESVRPYTPCRSNINTEIEEEDAPDMYVLFRQLCALNWILEAMMTEPPLAMESITKCWNIKYRELRQNTFCKTSQQKLRKEKHLESKWNMFITHPGAGHLRGRQRLSYSLSRQMRKMSVQPQQGAGQSVSSPQQSFVTSSMSFVPDQQSNSRMDEEMTSSARNSARGSARGSVRGGGGGAIEWDSFSQTRTEDGEGKTTVSRAERSASVASEMSVVRELSSSEMKRMNKRRSTLSKEQLEERDEEEEPSEKQVSSWVESTNQKLSSSDPRPASADLRPRKKPFKPSFPSKKLVDMTERLRNKFADVKEDNALELHDKLEAFEKKKYLRVEKKFNSIDCKKNRHISLQLTEFREVGREREESAEEKKKKKKLEDESKWFQELVRLLPDNIWSDRQCAAMMDKLQSMGKIESRKITPQKFLNVLMSLKHWELCAPDVRAAMEFVREKVVGMSVEEFEAWYRSEIEDLNRSKSAPPLSS